MTTGDFGHVVANDESAIYFLVRPALNKSVWLRATRSDEIQDTNLTNRSISNYIGVWRRFLAQNHSNRKKRKDSIHHAIIPSAVLLRCVKNYSHVY